MKRLLAALLRKAPDPDPEDVRYQTAVRMLSEVTELIKEKRRAKNPFRKVLTELMMKEAPSPVLVADAYEAMQEARIFKGPSNSHG